MMTTHRLVSACVGSRRARHARRLLHQPLYRPLQPLMISVSEEQQLGAQALPATCAGTEAPDFHEPEESTRSNASPPAS